MFLRLFPLLTSGKILSMTCEVTGLSKAAEEGVWAQGGGRVIPCMYVLRGKKLDRPHVRSKLRKNCRKKRAIVGETGAEPVGKRQRL